jgi:hypothetical protein
MYICESVLFFLTKGNTKSCCPPLHNKHKTDITEKADHPKPAISFCGTVTKGQKMTIQTLQNQSLTNGYTLQ